MFGKHTHVSPLDTQRRLLVAESELNRAELSKEWQTILHEVRAVARRATTIGTCAAAAAALVAGLWGPRRPAPPPDAAQPSWWQKLLKGVGLASTIWMALRARDEKEDDHQPRSGLPIRH